MDVDEVAEADAEAEAEVSLMGRQGVEEERLVEKGGFPAARLEREVLQRMEETRLQTAFTGVMDRTTRWTRRVTLPLSLVGMASS